LGRAREGIRKLRGSQVLGLTLGRGGCSSRAAERQSDVRRALRGWGEIRSRRKVQGNRGLSNKLFKKKIVPWGLKARRATS